MGLHNGRGRSDRRDVQGWQGAGGRGGVAGSSRNAAGRPAMMGGTSREGGRQDQRLGWSFLFFFSFSTRLAKYHRIDICQPHTIWNSHKTKCILHSPPQRLVCYTTTWSVAFEKPRPSEAFRAARALRECSGQLPIRQSTLDGTSGRSVRRDMEHSKRVGGRFRGDKVMKYPNLGKSRLPTKQTRQNVDAPLPTADCTGVGVHTAHNETIHWPDMPACGSKIWQVRHSGHQDIQDIPVDASMERSQPPRVADSRKLDSSFYFFPTILPQEGPVYTARHE